MLFNAPLEVARTNAWTSAPNATSASVRCEPMNPSAPVTKTVRPSYNEPNSGASESVQSGASAFIGLVSEATISKSSPPPHEAAVTASDALVWLVPAAFLQLLGALCASALAARDSYAVAACAYAGGGVLGLALFVVLADKHGIVSLAWGLTANGALVFAVPFAALLLRGQLRGPRALRWDLGPRLLHLLQ